MSCSYICNGFWLPENNAECRGTSLHPVRLARTTVLLNLGALSCSVSHTSQSSVLSVWEEPCRPCGLIPSTAENLSLNHFACEVLLASLVAPALETQ